MKFEMVATEFFISQIEKLYEKSKNQVKEKIQFISSKLHPCDQVTDLGRRYALSGASGGCS